MTSPPKNRHPIPVKRRYFRQLHEQYKIYDTAELPRPNDTLSVYKVIQKLAQKSPGWGDNPYLTLWPFRLFRVEARGRKRWLLKQSCLAEYGDCIEYENDWEQLCEPDKSPDTQLRRAARKVLKKARNEFLDRVQDNTLKLRLKGVHKEFSPKDFPPDVIYEQRVRICETGTLSVEDLLHPEPHRDTEPLIYVYVVERSLSAYLTMGEKAATRRSIDDPLRNWLIDHIRALYEELNARSSSGAAGKPTFPYIRDDCWLFASNLAELKGVAFALATFRDHVWSNSDKAKDAEAKERLPRKDGQRLTKEQRSLLEHLYQAYAEALKSDLEQSAGALAHRVVERAVAAGKLKKLNPPVQPAANPPA